MWRTKNILIDIRMLQRKIQLLSSLTKETLTVFCQKHIHHAWHSFCEKKQNRQKKNPTKLMTIIMTCAENILRGPPALHHN